MIYKEPVEACMTSCMGLDTCSRARVLDYGCLLQSRPLLPDNVGILPVDLRPTYMLTFDAQLVT